MPRRRFLSDRISASTRSGAIAAGHRDGRPMLRHGALDCRRRAGVRDPNRAPRASPRRPSRSRSLRRAAACSRSLLRRRGRWCGRSSAPFAVRARARRPRPRRALMRTLRSISDSSAVAWRVPSEQRRRQRLDRDRYSAPSAITPCLITSARPARSSRGGSDRERRGIDDDERRRVKRADECSFPPAYRPPSFRRPTHRPSRAASSGPARRDAAHVRRRDETREIADDAAAERDDRRVAAAAVREQRVGDRGPLLACLVLFAGGMTTVCTRSAVAPGSIRSEARLERARGSAGATLSSVTIAYRCAGACSRDESRRAAPSAPDATTIG